MAKMGRQQYELLAEACGNALADVRKRESKMAENGAWTVIDRIAGELKYDNDGFSIPKFKENIEDTAKLNQLTSQGVHL